MRVRIFKYVGNVICAFSNMSLPFRYLFSDSLLPWQQLLSLCTLYFKTDKDRPWVPGGERPYVTWLHGLQLALAHLPLVVHALLFERAEGNEKEKNKWAFSEGFTHASSLAIFLSADLANSLQHLIKEGLFWCFCMFSIYCPAAGIWWDALIRSPFRASQTACKVCGFFKNKQQASPRMWLLWGARATFA